VTSRLSNFSPLRNQIETLSEVEDSPDKWPSFKLNTSPDAEDATMNDEHERQQRDLRRATSLLGSMPREEMVEMLLDILSNERSDNTRRLSDWMAFQIILHDETRHARKLLAQLGKVSSCHLRVIWVSNQVHRSSEESQISCSTAQVATDLRLDHC
jgi:hypothetical protein